MPDRFHVGITGTRHALPAAQEATLGRILAEISATEDGPLVLHHGCCQGADEAAHRIVRKIGGWRIEGHPGHDAAGKSPWRMPADLTAGCDVLHPATRYSIRNAVIAETCPLLVAVPAYPEDDPRSARSGTWQTVRLARAWRWKGHRVMYVCPDGSVQEDGKRWAAVT